jgi:hypothetical protein
MTCWAVRDDRGTSPSIVALVRGGYEVAFQANTSNLSMAGAVNRGD